MLQKKFSSRNLSNEDIQLVADLLSPFDTFSKDPSSHKPLQVGSFFQDRNDDYSDFVIKAEDTKVEFPLTEQNNKPTTFSPIYEQDFQNPTRARSSCTSINSASTYQALNPADYLWSSQQQQPRNLEQDQWRATEFFFEDTPTVVYEEYPPHHHLEVSDDFESTNIENNEFEDGSNVYKCPHGDCKRQFTWLWALKEHERRHLASKKTRDYFCSTCGKGFLTKSCLKSHEKIHTRKPNSYECPNKNCDKTYSTSEGLRLHIRNHHQVDKRWICPSFECGKGFVRQSDLKLHIMRIHSKTRPHPCSHDNCSKSFACFSELRRHEQSHIRKAKKAALVKTKRSKVKVN